MATLIYGSAGDTPQRLERTFRGHIITGPISNGHGRGFYVCQTRAAANSNEDSVYRWFEDQQLPETSPSQTEFVGD